MADAQEFPEIEPGTFDVIVIGTGLQESIMAAAAASSGQSVLHIDSNSFYGHHWASLSLDEVTQWASSGGRFSATQPQLQINNATETLKSPDGEDLQLETLTDQILYSDFEQKTYNLEGLGPSRSFNLDIAGPKLCLCGGPLVDLLLKSGGSKYMEFKSVEGSYIWSGLGQGLTPVPDSRASIFQDRTLSLVEKKHLMRFFKLIQNQEKLSLEDLESSFVHFLDQQRLPSSIKSMILYAIALADYDQEDESQGQSTVLRTKDGIERLVLYLSSIGRFVNASGAFLYPVYGQAELPQAFCRTAAIKGTIYVLRMAVTGLLISKESRVYKGIKIASGQYLFSHKLVINFSAALPSGLSSSLAELKLNETESDDIKSSASLDASMELIKNNSGRTEQLLHPIIHSPSKVSWKVARCICITNQSLKPDLSTVLVAFPPRSIIGNQRTTIRALQLGSNTSACPEGMFVVYFSTPCSDPVQGKEALMSAIESLFMLPNGTPEPETSSLNINALERSKPTLLWFTLFVQQFMEDLEHLQCSVAQCCMPDETLCYRRLVMSTSKMFQDLFHAEMLFPKTVESEDVMENEDDLSN
ncbi:hypothetical protein SUGI_0111160 [Cryptomeria japonica]|uniref:rab escort protein 1 n=1 Tax=Cryptomeria japonica TaxID=3369 RepID=UPI002408DF01|nr:rab escort protein 1 [Cryptomeria japonica]XP_057872579.1 rab escort protein 1 [Cryptomeria japonica]GLJ09528.1 hypothetical protein SUGI_0111160 [Cryptomeria japonica]